VTEPVTSNIHRKGETPRQSALSRWLKDNQLPLWLVERSFIAQLVLRGNFAEDGFCNALTTVLGAPPPEAVNGVVRLGKDDAIICRLGPDECLLISDADAVRQLHALQQALSGQHAAVVDVSDGQIILRLKHQLAADLLSRHCPLDFHKAIFPPGSCAQSVLAKCNLIFVRQEEDCFDLVVRRSFAEYACQLLLDAAYIEGLI